MDRNILIIGKGNVLLKDEGVGVHIVQKIQADIDAARQEDSPSFFSWKDTELIEGGTSVLDLLDQLSGRKKVIIIDAVKTDDPPGTIFRFTLQELTSFQTEKKLSVHNINLRDVLHLTSFLDIPLPEIVIIGVNVKEVIPGETLSRELENKLFDIIKIVNKECCNEG
ncbi:MAG: hydrogenase maturation protease [Spirochaetales bacterium]|nr:hydrogenase maturation protease [Spirochaetales bacterium]